MADIERLGDAVRARRADLDLTQLEVHGRGGPSNSTLTSIENGVASSVSSATLRKIDTGLGWERGSARRVLDGGDPVVVAPSGQDDYVAAPGEPATVTLTEDELEGIIRRAVDEARRLGRS